MSLQDSVQRIQIERLVKYFGSARGESAINSGSEQKSRSNDDRYASRHDICFEPAHYFIAANHGHAQIHEDQIRGGGPRLSEGIKAGIGFKDFVA